MRTSFLTSALLIVALGQAGMASASVLYDDFNGTTLDTAKWDLQAGSPTIGGSVLATAGVTNIWSKTEFTDGVEFKVATAPTGHEYLCLKTDDGKSSLMFRNDGVTNPHYVAEHWTDATGSFESPAFDISAGDILGLAFTTSSAAFYKNGSLVWTSPAIDEQGNSAGLTSASAKVQMYTASGASIGIDSVSQGVTVGIPEPSAIVLLATGVFGLLAYAWRKRR